MDDNYNNSSDKVKAIAARYDASLGLTKAQFVAFSLFCILYGGKLNLNAAERRLVADFVAESSHNQKFHAVFSRAITKMKLLPDTAENHAAYAILRILFHTRHLEFFDCTNDKVATSYMKLKANHVFSQAEKTSLKEFSAIYGLADLAEVFMKLERLNLLCENPALPILFEKITVSRNIVNYLNIRIKLETRLDHPLFRKDAYTNGLHSHQQTLFYFATLMLLFVRVDKTQNVQLQPKI